MNPPNAILHELLNLAEIMLTNGAEVSRVEETLNRMGHAYGATQMNVFAITSSIVVTMVFEEGEEYTQTRRIKETKITCSPRFCKSESTLQSCSTLL